MNIYAFRTKSLEGKPIDLSRFSGKVTLLVNVTSECGYTPQYTVACSTSSPPRSKQKIRIDAAIEAALAAK